MTRIVHQEKPHLLICGNKFRSALVSRGQADCDWPTGISSSQWYISPQSETSSLIEILILVHYSLMLCTSDYTWISVRIALKDYLRDMRVWKSIREWIYIKSCSLVKDIAWQPWDGCLWTKFGKSWMLERMREMGMILTRRSSQAIKHENLNNLECGSFWAQENVVNHST